MIIIGEKINATRKSIAAAIVARDAATIIKVAQEQVAAGAAYLDVNGGDPRPGAEVENMKWLVELVQANTAAPLCIDSASPEAMETGLKLAKGKPIVNSISLEKERLEKFLPVVARHECMIIGLCMADGGAPTGPNDRLDRAGKLIEQFKSVGRGVEDVIIDPCFFPVSAQPGDGVAVLEAIRQIRKAFPGVHVGGGLSNVSYGLPGRKYVNLAMVSLAVYHGMDVALIDPGTPGMVPAVLATEAISGADEWCMNYVTASRQGKLP
jgi:5-methyltetrahydrofolate--homocysteine methyltransferase